MAKITNLHVKGESTIIYPNIVSQNIPMNAINFSQIQDDAIITQKIFDRAVTNPKIHDDAISTSKIQDNAISTSKIQDNAITNDKIVDNTIDISKLNGVLRLLIQTSVNKGAIPQYQNISVAIIKDVLTNINNKALSMQSLNTTIGGYPCVQIKYNNDVLDESKAIAYMKTMTGSEFLPVYNYNEPSNVFLIDFNLQIYKVQFDNTNGLVLYKMMSLVSRATFDNVLGNIDDTDGTYVLKAVVSSGTITYEWVLE